MLDLSSTSTLVKDEYIGQSLTMYSIKSALSGLKQLLATESPLKMIKNAFILR